MVSRSASSFSGRCLTTQTSRSAWRGHALADRADLAVADAADAEHAEHDQVVVDRVDVAHELGVVLAVHHARLEREARLAAEALASGRGSCRR